MMLEEGTSGILIDLDDGDWLWSLYRIGNLVQLILPYREPGGTVIEVGYSLIVLCKLSWHS